MNRISALAFALTVALFSHTVLHAQSDLARDTSQADSLMLRLKDAKHVGLSTDETLSGYVVYLYPQVQREQNLASLAAYREKLVEFKAKIESFHEARRKAQEERTSFDKLNGFTHERKQLESERPNSPFAHGIHLYDIVCCGVDYVEMRRAENPRGSVLIPLSRICKIVVTSTEDDTETGEPSDEPKSR